VWGPWLQFVASFGYSCNDRCFVLRLANSPAKIVQDAKAILQLSDLAQVPDEIDTEEAAATLFDTLGLSFALPLLSLLPKEWRRQKARPLDLACSKYAHALLALSSPLTAAGIWTMLFKAKARYQHWRRGLRRASQGMCGF
jgi:hypothetical protein